MPIAFQWKNQKLFEEFYLVVIWILAETLWNSTTVCTLTKVLEEKVIKLEKEEKARNALVLHSENIPDRVLQDLKKKDGLKVHKGKKFQPLKEGNQAAWKKGVKDGKEINLNQRTIKNQPGGKKKNS